MSPDSVAAQDQPLLTVTGLAASYGAAKVLFEATDNEYRFDFVFPDYSKEPVIRRGR